MIQGIVFDCDGTLADTMPAHWQAWRAVVSRHGIAFSEERFYALGGVPTRHILQMLAKEQNLSIDAQAIAIEKEQAYLERLTHVAPVEIVVQVARAHYGKIPMAVASGGTRDVINLVLMRLKIRDLFGAVVTSEDVQHQKPAPDIFLEAARRIGVPPHLCSGYEDTDLGMEAIRSAGMKAIDVRDMLAGRGYFPSEKRAGS